ncbi:type II and III secretion system protein family protein [Rhizobium sp. CF080]|uniref:type II and III secretion system protein family protein n=1 Tax=Rhizobium sp. (strain CF080) TaxID=1144310 RepID=UPI001FDA2B27|nr:type II and III secretion system protein family protein [Rhizobium sp. CF080]
MRLHGFLLLTFFVSLATCCRAESVISIEKTGANVTRHVSIGLNKTLIVELPQDAHDIVVSDPSVSDAIVRATRTIFLFGKKVGQTNIFILDASKRPIINIDIAVERDITGLEDNLRRLIPDAEIEVEIISDNIILSGTVKSAQDSAQAADLASAFVKGGEATTSTQSATSGGSQGSVALVAEDRQTSRIINLLRIAADDQVTLKLTIAEVKREILKQLGFDNELKSAGGSTIAQLGTASTDATTATSGGGLSALFSGSFGKYSLSTTLNALEQAKVVRTLAEPTLTAVSGQSASFQAGGEVLYSNTDSDGNTTQTPYTYGISLSFKPVVLTSGRISLQISTEVSEPVTSVSGSSPTYGKRSTSTTVELPSGGSIALAGLIRDNFNRSSNGTPVLNKIPGIGALFRQTSFERSETELVIIATPYLVRSVAAKELNRPDDNLSPTDDASQGFLNRINKLYGNGRTSEPTSQYHGTVGFIYK